MTRRLTARRTGCLALAAVALAAARLEVALRRNETVTATLRTAPPRAEFQPTEAQAAWLADFSWALRGLATRLPFRTDCLIRVLAARRVLRLRGWPVAIGIQAGHADGAFLGHSWLLCGGRDITGGPLPGLGILVDPAATAADHA